MTRARPTRFVELAVGFDSCRLYAYLKEKDCVRTGFYSACLKTCGARQNGGTHDRFVSSVDLQPTGREIERETAVRVFFLSPFYEGRTVLTTVHLSQYKQQKYRTTLLFIINA